MSHNLGVDVNRLIVMITLPRIGTHAPRGRTRALNPPLPHDVGTHPPITIRDDTPQHNTMSSINPTTAANFAILRECMSEPIIVRAAPSDASTGTGKRKAKHKPVTESSVPASNGDDAEELAEFIDVPSPPPHSASSLLSSGIVPLRRTLPLPPAFPPDRKSQHPRRPSTTKLPPKPPRHPSIILSCP